jgi:hypothetical protein
MAAGVIVTGGSGGDSSEQRHTTGTINNPLSSTVTVTVRCKERLHDIGKCNYTNQTGPVITNVTPPRM